MSEIKEELEYFADNLTMENEGEVLEQNSGLGVDKQKIDDDEYLVAPKGYEQEIAKTFGELPFEWRRYLHAREQEVDQGFSKLQNRNDDYKKLDDIYNSRSGMLKQNGIKSTKDWVENIAKIEAMLEHDPLGTISLLADSYGVKLGSNNAVMNPNKVFSPMEAMRKQMVSKQLDDFICETDDKGRLRHPYYREVVGDMYDLLNKGQAKNLADAYESAVWLNKNIRSKLIDERTKEFLELKSKNAQKSKEAAFAPKGKAVLDNKDLSLREELEMRFAEFGMIDEE